MARALTRGGTAGVVENRSRVLCDFLFPALDHRQPAGAAEEKPEARYQNKYGQVTSFFERLLLRLGFWPALLCGEHQVSVHFFVVVGIPAQSIRLRNTSGDVA